MVLVPDVSQLKEFGEDELLEQEQPVPLTEQEIPVWLPDEPEELEELEEPPLLEPEHAAMVARIPTLPRRAMRCFTMSTLRARSGILHGHLLACVARSTPPRPQLEPSCLRSSRSAAATDYAAGPSIASTAMSWPWIRMVWPASAMSELQPRAPRRRTSMRRASWETSTYSSSAVICL